MDVDKKRYFGFHSVSGWRSFICGRCFRFGHLHKFWGVYFRLTFDLFHDVMIDALGSTVLHYRNRSFGIDIFGLTPLDHTSWMGPFWFWIDIFGLNLFHIDGPEHEYKMHVGGGYGTPGSGNGMGHYNNLTFSTVNQDHDYRIDVSCACQHPVKWLVVLENLPTLG